MELIMEQFPIVIHSLNVGFLQTLKLFFATLLGAIPLGLVIAFGSMSHFKPLSYITNIVVWTTRNRQNPRFMIFRMAFSFHKIITRRFWQVSTLFSAGTAGYTI